MNHINLNDFRYMHQGKHGSSLTLQDYCLIKPVDSRGSVDGGHGHGHDYDKALLMLHGFSSTPAAFRVMISQLRHYDALVCPVLKGHAESIKAFSSSTAQDWRFTAVSACEALCKQYQHVDVLGLSLGGLLACELSQRFPLNHLFLLAPALKLNLPPYIMPIIKLLRYLGFCEVRNAAGNLISKQYEEIAYSRLPLVTLMEMISFAQHYTWVPPTCPTDLFLGLHDKVVVSKEVEQMFATLPNASIHWLKNSSHLIPLDHDVAQIIQCINSFELKTD